MKWVLGLALVSALAVSALTAAQAADRPDRARRAPAGDPAAMTMAAGAGVVSAVDPAAGKVTIRHGPIPALKWPAMTMAFSAASPALLRNVHAGEAVKFKLMRMDGNIQLTSIGPN